MGDYGQYDVPTVDTQVNFKVGQPAPSMLPLDYIREAANAKLAETDPLYLQYGHLYGFEKCRDSLVKFLTERYQYEVDKEKIMLTNGVTGTLALVCSLFLQAGDLVFAEEPTYFLAKSIFKDFKLNCRQIPMDEEGLDVYKLEQALEAGPVPKLMYVVPTAHNPTGRTLSAERREKLAALAAKYDFILLCDEVYQLLTFPHITPPPPMMTFAKHDKVLCMGSFSKILAPALRAGWLQGSKEILAQITACGQLDSSGGLNPVIFGIVQRAIDLGLQDKHLDKTRETLYTRYSTLEKALEEFLPEGTTFEKPQGGYFVLVKLPEGQLAADLLVEATENHKVCFLPGASFGDSMKNYLRLSFSYYDAEDIRVGIERLANAIRAYQAKLQ
ncbi:Aminotransferase swnA [Hondaea fermentalgiana]|uniref:Aminotransferase swnA n=1 Tax=Hondaea fermentalgiana TaxID=2315210 RepID=A0A2R5GEW8_9STRA|nr:Aminotransferase swnA [Hondaea fermentalgiana]|eukprot:GBG29457.1 Aminotransferase swnA [Hondaea fermentalgiana]